MGAIGIFTCKECGHEFRSQSGGGFMFDELRCVNCDKAQHVSRSELPSTTLMSIKDMWDQWDRTEEQRKAFIEMKKKEMEERLKNAKKWYCPSCGEEMKTDLKPMCPLCHSRQTQITKTEINFD